MAWFNFFRRSIKKSTPVETLARPKILDYLHINKSLMVEHGRAFEIQQHLEATYTPLPQRIFSIGHIKLTPDLNIKRYYLIDDDTWLQVSYSNGTLNDIILFYWVHAKTIQLSELSSDIKAPLTSLQWEHKGNLFDRCWQTPKSNIPLEIVEHLHNTDTNYILSIQQMLFSRVMHDCRKEYWLYSLEYHKEENNYQQVIAQGFSLLEKEILIN